MGTTVWVEEPVRDRLRQLQAAWGLPSVNATIERLLANPGGDAASLFSRHRAGIRAILRRHRLRGLTAFGSRARGDHRPDSDLDLAVRGGASASPWAILSAESELEALLGVPVRIVELPNARVQRAVERDGVVFDG